MFAGRKRAEAKKKKLGKSKSTDTEEEEGDDDQDDGELYFSRLTLLLTRRIIFHSSSIEDRNDSVSNEGSRIDLR